MGPEEGHVELAAVVADQEREPGDVGRELVEVDPLDEQGELAVAERPDHGHVVVFAGEPRRLDVEEQGPVGELGVEPPRLIGRQVRPEEAGVAPGERVDRLLHQRHHRVAGAPFSRPSSV